MTDYHTNNSEVYTRSDSLGSLRTLPKNKSDSSSRSVEGTKGGNVNELMKEIEIYKEKLNSIPELESKILLLEQNEQNLKRQKQTLQMEVSDLKIQIEKLKMVEENNVDEPSNSKINESIGNLSLKEAKEIIKELLNEIEEIKKEKNEISEKALNMLTEKELTNMELREQLEELKNSQYMEINNLAREMYSREDLDSINTNTPKKTLSNDFQFFRKSMLHNPSSTSLTQSIEGSDHKEIAALKEMLLTLESEKESIFKIFEEERSNYQNKISSLEDAISKLHCDLANRELESENILTSKNQDEINRNEIFSEIETLHSTIRLLEDKNAKSEAYYKEYSQKLKEELAEIDKINKNLRIVNEKLEKEIIALKNEYQVKLKSLMEKNKSDLAQKEKELRNLQMKNEELVREKVYIANEFETHKKNNEINKENYQKLQLSLQNIKENYDKEKKVYEERILGGEKRFESEKNKLIEQLTVLQTRFNQVITSSSSSQRKSSNDLFRKRLTGGLSIPAFSLNEESADASGCFTDRGGYPSRLASIAHTRDHIPTLSDCLEETANDDSPEALILDLENRIEAYEAQISELNLKINQFAKKEKEINILKFENSNLKENLERMKNIYEEQIKDLQKKNLLMNAELISKRKNSRSFNKAKEEKKTIGDKDIQIISNNLVTINNLTLEVENLKSLLQKERKIHTRHMNECDDKMSMIKVQIAQLSFDHESQIVKLKNENKKLKKEVEKYQKK